MFIGIASNSRRDTLKQALSQLITEHERYFQTMTPSAQERSAVMVSEARMMLREISASERLMQLQPPTHTSAPSTQDN